MREQAPTIVWRADIAAQHVARDSSLQASPMLQAAASGANWWGGPGVIWFGAALWLGARAFRRRCVATAGLRGVEALAVASAASAIIKGLAGRARPFVVPGEPWHWEFNRGWTEAQYFSMPSGHTTATTAFAVGVTLAIAGWAPRWRLAMAGPLLASAFVVGLGRMYANQHWLSDVIVAAILGAAASAALARVHANGPHPRYERVMLGPSPAAGNRP